MTRRALIRTLVAIGALGATTVGIQSSGATFTASSANPTSGVSAASDWVAPSVTLSSPGSYLRGSVAVNASATDSGSGIARMAIQYSSDATSYTDVCTSTSSPLSCSADTTYTPDGSYKLRATATDRSDNTGTSSVASVVIDNTAPSAAISAPAGPLDDTQTLTASASDATSGVARVTFQRAPSGTSTWTSLCTDTAAPYTCDWDTTTVADGSYDLRSVVVDNAGNSTTSATITRSVDNTAPTAASISTVNAGTAGRIETGDKLVLRYSEEMSLGTIISGWSSGTSPSFTVQIRNRSAVSGTTGDFLDFAGADLGSVDLAASNYALTTLKFTATATASTVNGGTQVTVLLGTRTTGVQGTVAGSVKPIWTPWPTATDLAGNTVSKTPVTQATASKGF